MNNNNENNGRINYGTSQTNPIRFQEWLRGLNGNSWEFDRIYGAHSLDDHVYYSVNAHPYLFRFEEDNVDNITYLTLCNQRVTEMQNALNNRAIFVSFDNDDAYLQDVLERNPDEFF